MSITDVGFIAKKTGNSRIIRSTSRRYKRNLNRLPTKP